jgi:glycosyltransferase involved in cell wall biosynthesis
MVTGIGFAMQGGGVRSALRALTENLYRVALGCASEAIFQNPDDHDLFVARRLAPRSLKTRVVNGSGINLSRFPETALPGAPIVFLMIARLLREKGVREYLEAAARIRTVFPSVVFRLVGPFETGPDRFDHRVLQEFIDAGVIEYLGPLSDVLPQLQHCTVYVLPSYREGTPRTVLEAMSVGRPIITTDVPGCRQTVEHGVNGFLVPARSVDALVSSMTFLIESPQLRCAMAGASRRLAESKYDVDKVNEDTIAGILGGKSVRRQSGGRNGGADGAQTTF